MVLFIKIVQVIFALSILILIHELGHYTFAKLFKTRVEQFYMFFNPKFSLFRCKRFGGKLHCRFFSKNDQPLPPDSDLTGANIPTTPNTASAGFLWAAIAPLPA